MLYNRCTGIYKFGNNTYPRRIRGRSTLGNIFREKKCVLWAGNYGKYQGSTEYSAELKAESKQKLLKPQAFTLR